MFVSPQTFLRALVAHKLKQPIARGISFPTAQFTTVEFCETILGFAPTGAQLKILAAYEQHQRVFVRSGRRVGKSRILAAIALSHFCRYADATAIIISPSEPQLREISFHDVVDLFHQSGRCLECKVCDPDGPRPCEHSACIDGELFANPTNGLRTADDARRLFGRAPRDPNLARGLNGNVLILIDESSAIDDALYDVLDGNLAGGGKLIAFGNPVQRSGWFYRASMGEIEGHALAISSRESPNVKMGRVVVPYLATLDWIESKEREWGPEDARTNSEIDGEFPSRDATRLISDVELAGAFERWATMPEVGALQFGIDPAGGGGGDKSVVACARGDKVLEVRAFQGATDVIVGELVSMLGRYRRPREPVHVNFDGSAAWGADLGNALRNLRLRDEALTFEALDMRGGGKTDAILIQSKCARRVDAYWLNATIALKTVAGVQYDAELREEFVFSEWEQDREGGTRLRDKRSFRAQLGRSPDKADAVCFCLWRGRVQALSDASRVPEWTDDPPPAPPTTSIAAHHRDHGQFGAFDPYSGLDPWGGGGRARRSLEPEED